MDMLKFAMLASWLGALTGRVFDSLDIETLRDRIAACFPDPVPNRADANTIKELLNAMRDGRKIEAIKAYRALTGFPLKESKDFIEANWFEAAKPIT